MGRLIESNQALRLFCLFTVPDRTGKNEISALVVDREFVYDQDIVEAHTRLVHQERPSLSQAHLRYGTVGTGTDVARLVWPQASHVFSSQSMDLASVLPGRPSAAAEIGPPGRVPTSQLHRTPVDILLVDQGVGADWERWVRAVERTKVAPSVVVLACTPDHLAEKSLETARHCQDKRLKQSGYGVEYWYLRAHDFGAALHQDRLFVVYYLLDRELTPPIAPVKDGLPPRPMANLLAPYGTPPRAYVGGDLNTSTGSFTYGGPCLVEGRIGGALVFSPTGIMPDDLSALVRVQGRCRRLQTEELAKAKGVPTEWLGKPARKIPARAIGTSTGLHLWAAVGDAVLEWAQREETTAPPSPPEELQAHSMPHPPAPCPDPPEDYIGWQMPNLELGGAWHKARQASLRAAVQGLADADQLIAEGEAALAIHRENYTDEGPKRLQLLWWEFPPEHWEALRTGSSMNFLIQPSGELELNSDMDEQQLEVATQFVDELVALGVLVEATETLRANGPLFLVPKPGQPGEWRCISDMKRGGQNQCMGKDPTYLPRAPDILPRLYMGGYSAVADASKHFYNFPTRVDERPYLGCIHPRTQRRLWYVGLPMGSANSPAIACRLGDSGLRLLRAESPLFQGQAVENSWRQGFRGHPYNPRYGHGRVIVGEDGEPAALLFAHVDDYFIHGPSLRKTCLAFNAFMDQSVRLGIICRETKTRPPAQQQKFCGFIYDTRGTPRLVIPNDKVSKALASIQYLRAGAAQGRLARLTLAVVVGRLQSLVDATPRRIGNSYLRRLYDELHESTARQSDGRLNYFTVIQLSPLAWLDLEWWEDYLRLNPGATGPSGQSGTLVSTWGDGSGTGAGGTMDIVGPGGKSSPMRAWMGTWAPEVHSFSSNWRELRTLYQTLARERATGTLRGSTVFYFTDNLVSYYIMQSGASTSPELHKLALQIKRLELLLECYLEVIHVPGQVMIHQGTDGLSRGLWVAAERSRTTSLIESSQALDAVPFVWPLARWVEREIGLPSGRIQRHFGPLDQWDFPSLAHQWSLWTPTPEVARQALAAFLVGWVEVPLSTGAVFLIPRVLQRTWAHLSHSVVEFRTYCPRDLPLECQYPSDIPFVLLVIWPHVRRLPDSRVDEPPIERTPHWIRAQIEGLHRV
jgi:hypothetical protein